MCAARSAVRVKINIICGSCLLPIYGLLMIIQYVFALVWLMVGIDIVVFAFLS